MPMPVALSHKLARAWLKSEKKKVVDYLRPDGKTQVTMEYKYGEPYRVSSVVIGAQHNPDVTQAQIKKDMIEHVIKPIIPVQFLDSSTDYYVNATGRFVIGGPASDTGFTGRKILVDTYGGMARHGGGAFSGKDPTKVDRSAAYFGRYVAKNIVAAVWPSAVKSRFHMSSGSPSAFHFHRNFRD